MILSWWFYEPCNNVTGLPLSHVEPVGRSPHDSRDMLCLAARLLSMVQSRPINDVSCLRVFLEYSPSVTPLSSLTHSCPWLELVATEAFLSTQIHSSPAVLVLKQGIRSLKVSPGDDIQCVLPSDHGMTKYVPIMFCFTLENLDSCNRGILILILDLDRSGLKYKMNNKSNEKCHLQ